MRAPAGLALLAMMSSCLPREEAITAPASRTATAAVIRKLAIDLPADIAAKLPELTEAGANLPALPLSAAPPLFALSSTQSPDDATRAIDCLTAAVYYEARSQSDDGQRAVAQVVLNRVRDRAFPSSVCGVVFQGSTRRTGCQFSFTCDGSMAFRRQPNAWAHAREIAVAALSGQVYAPVGSATFYHANYVLPYWASSFDKVATIGAHIFYRWKSGLENALAFRQPYSGAEPSLSGRTSAASEMAGGSSTYKAQELVNGVLIHRGAAPAAAVAAVSAPLTTASAALPVASGKRIKVLADMAGVRIHRGESTPPPDATTTTD